MTIGRGKYVFLSDLFTKKDTEGSINIGLYELKIIMNDDNLNNTNTGINY